MRRNWWEESELVIDALVALGVADWGGVGRFRVLQRHEREGRHPQTGDLVTIAARRAVRFERSPAWPGDAEDFRADLEASGELVVPGFGTFILRHYGAYDGRDPATGAVIAVPATRAVFYKPAVLLRARVASAPAQDGESDLSPFEGVTLCRGSVNSRP